MGRTIKKMDIVNVLIEYKKGKRVSEIIKNTSHSKSTVHKYLNVYKEKFEPIPPFKLSRAEIEELNEQALEVRNALLFENRDQSGRKKQDNIT